jgi:hypothetical protein
LTTETGSGEAKDYPVDLPEVASFGSVEERCAAN